MVKNTTKEQTARPFLKWAGGKGQLLDKFSSFYPQGLLSGTVTTYIEPFVGGGAVLFDVLQRFGVERAIIVDTNKELINCYKCVKEDVIQLIAKLKALQKEYLSLSMDSRREMFLKVRNRYNQTAISDGHDYDKAADFIFLNKACFNGLYRVNSKGDFNVPFGKYKKPNICDADNLIAINGLLQRVTILHGEYSQCREYICDNTFVYFDPPYRPITPTQSFVGYSQSGFNDDDQRDLAEFVREVSMKGCKILLSNSDPKNANPDDNFFDNLYNDFFVSRIMARRIINCQADKRGSITEIIVANYKGAA